MYIYRVFHSFMTDYVLKGLHSICELIQLRYMTLRRVSTVVIVLHRSIQSFRPLCTFAIYLSTAFFVSCKYIQPFQPGNTFTGCFPIATKPLFRAPISSAMYNCSQISKFSNKHFHMSNLNLLLAGEQLHQCFSQISVPWQQTEAPCNQQ